jgi:hypothetical protein
MILLVSSTIGSLFQYFLPLFWNRKHALKGVILICIPIFGWRTRNERIFKEIVIGPEKIFDRIQVVSWSWKWLLAKKASSPYLFYEWRLEPFDCIVC